jgi:PAS domain S-box-containing protein
LKKKILIVEDEGIVALHIEYALKSIGYEISGIACSGEEAIDKVKNTHPDLVLMDIVLKGETDGIEAAEQIRDRFDVPVVYLTAFGDENTLQRAKVTVPFGYILKPFKERELHIAIEIALYRYEIEARLKAMERFRYIILSSIGDAIITTDTEGRITFSNSVAGVLTGWDMEEAVNKNITDVFNIVNERTDNPLENPAIRVISDGIDLDLGPYTNLLAKDGKEIPVDGRGAPLAKGT